MTLPDGFVNKDEVGRAGEPDQEQPRWQVRHGREWEVAKVPRTRAEDCLRGVDGTGVPMLVGTEYTVAWKPSSRG